MNPKNSRFKSKYLAIQKAFKQKYEEEGKRTEREKGKQGNGECKEEKGDAMLDGNKRLDNSCRE